MAADTLHNFLQPLDVNNDSQVTAMDALVVINRIHRGEGWETRLSADQRFFDVNDDSKVTPIDALRVINGLNREANIKDVAWRVELSEGERVGIQLRNAPSGVGFEVRLQNASPEETYPIYLEDSWVGTITADIRGRGILELRPELGIEGTIPSALLMEKDVANIRVETLTEIELDVANLEIEGLPNHDSSESDNRILVSEIESEENRIGRALYIQHQEHRHLGIYARGMASNENVNVFIGDNLLGVFTANRAGILLLRVSPADYPELPTIQEGTTISIEGVGDGTFNSLHGISNYSPPEAYAAVFASSPNYIGGSGLLLSENRTRIALALSRVEPNTTYVVSIDNVDIFEVTSDRRGRIEYLFDSRRNGDDELINPLPPIDEGSEIRVGELISATFYASPTNR